MRASQDVIELAKDKLAGYGCEESEVVVDAMSTMEITEDGVWVSARVHLSYGELSEPLREAAASAITNRLGMGLKFPLDRLGMGLSLEDINVMIDDALSNYILIRKPEEDNGSD